jgi:hypothetical protein
MGALYIQGTGNWSGLPVLKSIKKLEEIVLAFTIVTSPRIVLHGHDNTDCELGKVVLSGTTLRIMCAPNREISKLVVGRREA